MQRYAAAARGLVDELIASLPSAEIDALRDDLRGAGLANWLLWEREHQPYIEEFLASTPTQRARKKAWAAPQDRRLLVYGAICHAARGAAFLAVLSESLLCRDLSYRTAAAASVSRPS